MRRNLFLAGSIIAFGVLAAGSVFAFSFFQTDTAPASPQWTQQAGLGVAVPACGSSSVGGISCVNGGNSVPFTWKDDGDADGITCKSAYIFGSGAINDASETVWGNSVILDNLPCSGSKIWHPANNNSYVTYAIRYRTAERFTCEAYVQTCDSKSGVCANAIPLQCAAGRTETTTYPHGQGHLIASGTFATNNCQPPTPDIKANDSDGPLNLDFGTAILTWKVGNKPTSCTASGAWSGDKPEEGVETVFTEVGQPYTYTLSCTNYAGTVADSVTVNSNPALSANVSFTPASPVDPNTAVTWTANVSGGSGTYNYAWTCDGQSCGTNSGQVQQTYTTDGPRIAMATVTSGIQTAIAFASLVVNQGLGVSIDVSPANPSVGDIVTWAANATGGQGPGSYAYTWNLDGAAKSGNPVAMTYGAGGQKNASVAVTSGSQTANANRSVSVAWLPVSADIKANGQNGPISVEFGQSATLTWTSTNAESCKVTPGGWTGKSNNIGQSTGPLTANTTYTLDCAGAGGSDSDPVTINVGNELTGSCSASPSLAIVNQPLTWAAVASGGSVASSYAWAFTGHDVTAGTGRSVNKVYSTAGQKGASVTIISGSQTVTSVCSGATVYQPTLIIDPAAKEVLIGGTTQLQAKYDPDGPSGTQGEEIVTVSNKIIWSSSASTKASVSNGGLVSGVFPTAADAPVTIAASYTDPYDNVIPATAVIGVTAPPLEVSCSTDPASNASTKQPVTWRAQAGGGTGDFTYSWTVDGTAAGTAATAVKSFTAAGLKTGSVIAHSGLEDKAAACAVTIHSPTFTIEPGTASAAFNGTTQLQAKYDPDGAGQAPSQEVTVAAEWSSQARSVATVDANGLVSGVFPGSAVITASYTDQYGNALPPASAAVTITAPPLSVSCSAVDPVSNTALTNIITRQDVNWTVTRSGGTGTYTYAWTGDVTGSAQTVPASYTAAGARNANVSVTSGLETLPASCGVEVRQPTLIIDPAAKEVLIRGTTQLQAKYDPDGPSGTQGEEIVTTSGQISWFSSNETIVSVNNDTQKGLVRGEQMGTAIISGAYRDNFGNAITAEATIQVRTSPIQASCAASPSIATKKQPVTWAANVASGGNGIYSYSWSSNTDAALSGIGSSVTKAYSDAGRKTAQVTVSSAEHTATISCSDTEVYAPTFVTVPGSDTILPGSTRQLTGLYDPDGPSPNFGNQEVTTGAGIIWISNNPSVASVSASGLVTAAEPGAALITATYTDSFENIIPASSAIGVNTPDLAVSCSVSPTSAVTKQRVTWSSGASGGLGAGSYAHKWSGTDGLTGAGASLSWPYNNEGYKTGVVVITSGDQTATSTECSSLLNGIRIYKPTLVVVTAAGDSSTAIERGGTVQLYAKFDQDGPDGVSPEQDVAAASFWESSSVNISVDNTATKGLVTGNQSGSANITATYRDTYENSITAAAVVAVNNGAPVAKARVATDGVNFSDSIVVIGGTAVTLTLDASESFDPNGWTDAAYGVSSGGRCEWNADLDTPLTFETPVNNPAGPVNCNITLPQRTFPQAGTFTYPVLKITDKLGAVSDVDTITIVVENPNVGGSCTLSPASGVAIAGQEVTWTAAGAGGNGTYAYSWSGTDLAGAENPIKKIYAAAGPKTASVAISSAGQPPAAVACPPLTVTQPTFVIDAGANALLPLDQTLQLRGLYDADGPSPAFPEENVTAAITTEWSSGAPTIIAVDKTDQKGLVTALRSGSAVITATHRDAQGNSITAAVTITAENAAPVANAKISKDNATFTDAIVVTQGLPVTIYLSAADSSDPNGWTDAAYGVSSGGRCEWNSNLDRENPPIFEQADTKNNPASPSACSISLGAKTFNDAPNTYTYQVLKITDNGGKVSENIDTVSITVVAAEPLAASCAVLPTVATRGQSVAWSVNPSGGTGINTYAWTGTDNLSGTARTVNKIYASTGSKNAQVTVQSGVQTAPITNCPTVNVYEPTFVISPAAENISVNDAVQLEALYDADGPDGPDTDAMVTGAADWSSSDDTIAVVVDGFTVGKKAGTATITAVYLDNYGNRIPATATVNVFMPTLEITPRSFQVGRTSENNTFALRVRYDPDGSGTEHDPQFIQTGDAEWFSSKPSVAAVSGLGVVTGREAGTAIITAAYQDIFQNDLAATSNVAVVQAPRLACSPAIQEVLVNRRTSNLRGIGGDPQDYNWSASEGSDSRVAGRTFSTVYTSTGEKTITLESLDFTAACTVTVVDPGLTVAPVDSQIIKRETIQLEALYDSDGPDGPNEPEDLAPFSTWCVDDGNRCVADAAIAKVSTAAKPRGLVTGKTGGTATVNATFIAFSKTLEGAVTVRIREPSLTVNPGTANLSVSGPDDEIQLEAFYDPDGETGTQAAEDVTLDAAWSSGAPTKASVTNTATSRGLVRALASGVADITAAFTDTLGNILTPAISRITVTSDSDLSCSPQERTAVAGSPASFSATGGNNTYSWITSSEGAPSTGNGSSFSVTFSTPGPRSVEVTSSGQTDTCVANIIGQDDFDEDDGDIPPQPRDPNAPAPIRGFREVPPNPNLLRPKDIIPNIRGRIPNIRSDDNDDNNEEDED